MSTRAIGHENFEGGYRLLAEQTVTSGVSEVVFTLPAVWEWINGMYVGDKMDMICVKFYNVHAASNHVWFQFALSPNSSGTSWQMGSTQHQIVASDRSEQKWWQAGTSNSENIRNTSTGSDALKLGATGVSGVASSNIGGYINIYNAYDTNMFKQWWGEVFGDTDKLNNSSANERITQYWPNGQAGVDSHLRRIRFNMSSGNIDAGIFRMYGLRRR